MGAGGSAPDRREAVDRCGLSEEQYGALRGALGAEGSPGERVELQGFLARFPAELRPVALPLFFQLGGEGMGVSADASWASFVAGVAGLVHAGGDWGALLGLWPAEGGEPQDELLHAELAARLCFWCAVGAGAPRGQGGPEPGAGADAAEAEGPGGAAGAGGADPELLIAALRPPGECGEEAGALQAHLERAAPMLPRAVGARVATLLLGAPPPPDHLSAVLAQSRAVQGDAGLLLLLRSMDPLLWYSDDWRPLFRDWKDGQSFGALVGGTMHYGGPALLVVRTADGHLVGAVSSSWRELNGKFGGGADCFLFSVTPTLQVMRGSGRSQNYMYFNSKNRHAPRGIGFGGQAEMCRLWLDSDFERCHVLESDATYQEGRLLPGDDYQIPLECACVEVWGCGGAEAAEAQGEQRSRDQGLRDQARKVDRARMLETEFDKEVLFEKAFAKGSASKHTDQC